MNENNFCPECGNNLTLLNDNETGEIVCTTCGLVIGSTEYTPPADYTPTKTAPTHPIAYTSLSVGREIDSYQQLEIAIAKDTQWIVQKLNLPYNTTQTAINYVRKLRKATRRHNPYKIRFTRTELTALSIWNALKQLNHPISYDEFTKQITSLIGNINLMKTQNRANYFLKTHNRIPNTNFVIAHINKTINILANKHVINNIYANILNKYAIQMILTNPQVVAYRRAKLVAAAAVLAADKLLVNRLRLQPFAKLTKNGTGKLSSIATTLKRAAPPLPKQCAAIKLCEYITQVIERGVGFC